MADQTDNKPLDGSEHESIVPADELYDLDISLDEPEEESFDTKGETVDNDLLDDLDLDDIVEDEMDPDSSDVDEAGISEQSDNSDTTSEPDEEIPLEESIEAPVAISDVDGTASADDEATAEQGSESDSSDALSSESRDISEDETLSADTEEHRAETEATDTGEQESEQADEIEHPTELNNEPDSSSESAEDHLDISSDEAPAVDETRDEDDNQSSSDADSGDATASDNVQVERRQQPQAPDDLQQSSDTDTQEEDTEDALAALFDRPGRGDEPDEPAPPTSASDDELADFLDDDLEELDISLDELEDLDSQDDSYQIVRSPDELNRFDEQPDSIYADSDAEMPDAAASNAPPAPEMKQPESAMPTSTPTPAEVPKKSGFSMNMADSITMSMGLVALLIAAAAVWLALDSSGEVTALQSEPKKIEMRISKLEKQQAETIRELEQKFETLQQQFGDLTKVVASKSSQQWQNRESEHNVEANAVVAQTETIDALKTVAQPAAVKKPVVKAKPVIKKDPPLEVPLNSKKGWMVNLQSLESEKAATAEVRRLRAKDIRAEFVRFPSKGRIWYRVRVSGFKQEHEAIAYKKFLKEFHSIEAWHHKLP